LISILLGISLYTGFLSLVTAPDVKAVADLRGRTLSVDALTTDYAFVLFEILGRSGLYDGDYALLAFIRAVSTPRDS
jgi:hypothetical protein